jgi:hypothetical protein
LIIACLTFSHHSSTRHGTTPFWLAAKGAILELRAMTRYRLDLPVTFRWKDRHGRDKVGAGFTQDVSATAVFVFSNDCPPPDEILHCEVKLPRLRDAGCVPVTVSGRVVRIEQGTDWRRRGFVVEGEMLRLCNELWTDAPEDTDAEKAKKFSSKRLN